MIKYAETSIVFREFPDEVTLAINLTNCPYHCPGCHSPHLQEDTGKELTEKELGQMLDYYKGRITCVGFMGGDGDKIGLYNLAKSVKVKFPGLKIGWYSGSSGIPPIIHDTDIMFDYNIFDYMKIGPYINELGPLDSPTTNQRLYRRVGNDWEYVPMFKDPKQGIEPMSFQKE